MKIARRAIQAFALVACTVAIAPAAFARAERGFYLGASVGISSYDVAQADLDKAAYDFFLANVSSGISGNSTFSDEATAAALIMGYRFLPYVAMEFSYLDLGTVEYSASGTVVPDGRPVAAPATVNFDVHTTAYTGAALGSVPIGEIFDVHGSFGLFVNHTKISGSSVITYPNGTGSLANSKDRDSVGQFFGFGAAFHFAGHFTLSVDWVRYMDIGNEEPSKAVVTLEGFDAHALTLSALYRF